MHPSDINSGPEETGPDGRKNTTKQFATLRSFKEVESLNVPCVVDEALELEEQEQSEFAMKISNYANLALLGLKIYATVQSGSIAIIAASTLDSLLDLMAGGILWFTQLSTKNINIYKYPIGKLRVQPVGVVVFAAVMTTLGVLKRKICTGRSNTTLCPQAVIFSLTGWSDSSNGDATEINLSS